MLKQNEIIFPAKGYGLKTNSMPLIWTSSNTSLQSSFTGWLRSLVLQQSQDSPLFQKLDGKPVVAFPDAANWERAPTAFLFPPYQGAWSLPFDKARRHLEVELMDKVSFWGWWKCSKITFCWWLHNPANVLWAFIYLFFYSSRVSIQSLTLAKQCLQPFCFSYFSDRVLWFFPGPASKSPRASYLGFLSRWDCRHAPPLFFVLCFETESYCAPQAGLELSIVLPLCPTECWNYRCAQPCPAKLYTFSGEFYAVQITFMTKIQWFQYTLIIIIKMWQKLHFLEK
jgi:hypothetical protein